MNNLNSSIISRSSNFQILGISRNNFDSNDINDCFNILNSINESLNRNLNQSVFDLMKCFICLSPTTDPLSCPKCNNFACKKCLEKYFDHSIKKKCPLCKQDIVFDELIENELITDIEDILNKDIPKNNKINELTNLIEKKKNYWNGQNDNINILIEKFIKYQEIINDYKKQYNLFFLSCQKIIEDTLKTYSKKVEDLINSLVTLNDASNKSIDKYKKLNNNYINDYYNKNKIKDLINELLIMDRNHFNEKNNDESEKLLNTSIKIVPYINHMVIREIVLKKELFNKYSQNRAKGNHYKLGNYELIYNFITQDGYKAISRLIITAKEGTNSCFLITQNKVINNNKQGFCPMRLIDIKGRTYNYECKINYDEFDIGKEKEVKMIIEALIFSV